MRTVLDQRVAESGVVQIQVRLFEGSLMSFNEQKIEDTVLALLGCFATKDGRTWKRYEFSVMESLHEKGFISDPRGKHESVFLTPAGLEMAQNLAKQLFSN